MYYSYYNVIGELLYKRSYDSIGKVIEEFGDIVVQQVIDPPETGVGDTITVRVYVVNPPGVSQVVVGLDKDNRKYPLFHEEKETGIFKEQFHFAEPGSFRIAYEATLLDTINHTSQMESNSFVLRFRPE